eukprot:Hpha_TRINITY_DN7590_c0_g1::TRINITY_DN7590_c0_g1_i1::g.18823::m.18823
MQRERRTGAPPLAAMPCGGQLGLAGAPGMRAVPAWLREADVIVTLLTEKEMEGRKLSFAHPGEGEGEPAAASAPLARWARHPIPNAKFEAEEEIRMLLAAAETVVQALLDGLRVLVHCSAGLHRTGATAYAALRLAGLEHEAVLQAIGAAREQTADELGRRQQLVPAALRALEMHRMLSAGVTTHSGEDHPPGCVSFRPVSASES